jgi:hypothetical protein
MASAQILTNGKALYAYNGTEWVPLNTAGNLVNSTRWQKVVAGGETSLSGNDDSGESLIYTPGYEQVYLNGVLLARDVDYTATTGTTITALTALTAGHIIEILAYNNINVGNTYTQGQIDNKIANTFTRWVDTLSASATVLSGLDDNSTTLSYTPGLEQVYVNGILLLPSEYTATSGSSVVLSEAAVSGDVIQIYTLKNFRVPNTYTIGQTDDQFLTKTSASSTYLTQAAGITAATASATYAPLAAGGLVQIVPTSIAVGSGTGSISSNGTVSFSGSCSSVSVNGCFTSNYKNYKIVINCISANSTPTLYLRVRSSGTDNGSNYYYAASWRQTSTSTFNTDNGDPSSVFVIAKLGNNQTLSNIEIGSPFEGVQTSYSSNSGALDNTNEGYTMWAGGSLSNTVSYDGFTILSSSGNLTSGTISIYGYRN